MPAYTAIDSIGVPALHRPVLTFAVKQRLRDSYKVSHVFLKFHLDSTSTFTAILDSG